jgi:pimeloyl-ACP methyl ester carboxylesterase
MSLPVVLLHGQPGSARDWDDVVPLLADLQVLVEDRPGYDGDRAAMGFEGNAAAVAERLDALAAGPAVVAGHSWGAGVATALALVRPDLVAGLVLVAPAAVASSVVPGDRWVLRPRVADLMTRHVGPALAHFPGLVARGTGSRLSRGQRARARDVVAGRDSARDWAAWLVEQRALVDELPALERRYPGLTTPTVVLAGRHDRAVSLVAVRDLVTRVPGARLVELDTGHLLQMEAPEAVAAAVRGLADADP